MEEVAGAWMESIGKIDSASAKAMCVPAVAIAAGSSYDTPACPKAFDSTAEGGEKSRGIWQIGLMYYSPDRKKQAQAVYQFYTSDNPDYGCLSDWCKQTTCGVAHDGIGQDDKVIGHHRFCKGAWPASSGQYAARLLAVGGKVAVAAACANAAKLGSLKNTSVPFKEWDAAQAPAATTTVAEAAAKSVSVHRSVTCENEHEDWECDAWQSTGECEANPEYMHKTCALSSWQERKTLIIDNTYTVALPRDVPASGGGSRRVPGRRRVWPGAARGSGPPERASLERDEDDSR
eukprot:scaffold11939_cov73-Phaeocystis_antarctica.AAC.1